MNTATELDDEFSVEDHYNRKIIVHHQALLSHINAINEKFNINMVLDIQIQDNTIMMYGQTERPVKLYSWFKDGSYASHVFSSLRIDTYVDYLSNVSKYFSYENYLYHTFQKDMRAYGLSAYFYNTDKDFEDLLATFLFHAGNHPFIFYDFFNEYPRFMELMNGIEHMIQFLELFKTQYINDPDLLKSKILLIEMKLI